MSSKMLKIKQNGWREWGRLAAKLGLACGIYYLVFGVLFGLSVGVGRQDGSLLFFCRLCNRYGAGDAVLLKDGELTEYSDGLDGMVAGKVIAALRVRGFYDEGSE